MARLSSVSLPRSQKGQSGSTSSCFSATWEPWLGKGLPSCAQLCPGWVSSETRQGQLFTHCAPAFPAAAHTETRYPRSWLNQLSQARAQQ